MARQRRGGGFKPPELRGTLGTLLRTAAAQVGPLRDVLERTAREGRARFDDVRTSRRRSDALAELGEIVLELIRAGEIDVAELPEVRDIVAHLDDIDAGGHPDEDDRDLAPPPAKSRFDSRRRDEDDGTVSSGAARTWSPSVSRAPSRPAPSKPAPRVWRPPVDEVEAEPHRPVDAGRPRATPLPRKDAQRKGGISFEDDDDLADYMHPDDVPAKKPDNES